MLSFCLGLFYTKYVVYIRDWNSPRVLTGCPRLLQLNKRMAVSRLGPAVASFFAQAVRTEGNLRALSDPSTMYTKK